MGGRPCTGPCDISWVEWAGYAVGVVVALGAVWLAHRIVRRAAGSNPGLASLVPVLTGGVAVALTVLLTVAAMDLVNRHAWPTVVIGLRGVDPADPVPLGGAYGVEWSASSGQSDCHLDATLHRPEDPLYAETLVSEVIPARTNTGGPTSYLTVDRDRYYVEAVSDCAAWSITFTPRQ
jgi:hypothetical protein